MKVTILTGAGVSASAGIPTYREATSHWRDEQFEKMNHANRYGNYLPILIPAWLQMGQVMLNATPTQFHKAVAEHGWSVITQNVDGLHQRAGSENVFEVHGSIMRWKNVKEKRKSYTTLQDLLSVADAVNLEELRIRPDVVLFGERPMYVKECTELVKNSDVVVFVGTSGNVYPVAEWYQLASKSVLVDPVKWGDFTHHIPMKADEWAEAGCPLK